jgi:hypothetical protein
MEAELEDRGSVLGKAIRFLSTSQRPVGTVGSFMGVKGHSPASSAEYKNDAITSTSPYVFIAWWTIY